MGRASCEGDKDRLGMDIISLSRQLTRLVNTPFGSTRGNESCSCKLFIYDVSQGLFLTLTLIIALSQ
jgi:hypothetical protein